MDLNAWEMVSVTCSSFDAVFLQPEKLPLLIKVFDGNAFAL